VEDAQRRNPPDLHALLTRGDSWTVS
jgi:hypothetical protein